MTIYILKEIISTKYNRSDEERFNRSIAFVIQNTTNGNLALFQLDRIAKKVAALRCNNRSCGHRLSIEHTIPTEAYGKYKGRKIAMEVTKADLLDSKNWLKVYHDHSKLCKMTGKKFRFNNFNQNLFRLIESFRMILISLGLNEENLLK